MVMMLLSPDDDQNELLHCCIKQDYLLLPFFPNRMVLIISNTIVLKNLFSLMSYPCFSRNHFVLVGDGRYWHAPTSSDSAVVVCVVSSDGWNAIDDMRMIGCEKM